MIGREEIHTGEVEFDVIINGECTKRVCGGLLAHYSETGDGLEVIARGIHPIFMANIVVALTAWLVQHGHGDLLLDGLKRILGDPK